MSQIKKILTIIILAIALALISVAIFSNTKNTKPAVPEVKNNPEAVSEEEARVANIKNTINGKITKVDFQELVLETENKEEMKLHIPEKDVKFFKETKVDESITLEEIGLLDIEIGSNAQIEYNPETSNLYFVKVLMK